MLYWGMLEPLAVVRVFCFISLCGIFERPMFLGFSIMMLWIALQVTMWGLFTQPRRHFGSGSGLCFSSKLSVTECNQILVSSYTGCQTSPSVSHRRFVGSSCFGRGKFSIYSLPEGRRIGCGWKEMVYVDGGENILNATPSSFLSSLV